MKTLPRTFPALAWPCRTVFGMVYSRELRRGGVVRDLSVQGAIIPDANRLSLIGIFRRLCFGAGLSAADEIPKRCNRSDNADGEYFHNDSSVAVHD